MTGHREERSRRFLARWIHWSCRLAWPVIVLAVLLAGGAAYFTLTHLTFDTGLDRILPQDRSFRQNEIAIGEALPQTTDALSIVVESDDAETADEAAASLAARLETMPEHFRTVFYFDGHPFFRRNSLLYLGVDKLEDMSARLVRAQPLLSSLAADPTLRGLTETLRRAIDQSDDKAAAALAPALSKMAATVRNLEEGRDARLSWQSLLDGDGTADATTTRKVILVQPVPGRDPLRPVAAAVDAIYESAKALALDDAGGVEVHVTGNAIMLQEELQTVRGGMAIAGLLALGLAVLLLAFGLQSLRLVAATLFTLVVGLTWTAAFALAAFGALNLVSAAFAVLFTALSIDFSIHFALRYREALADNAYGEALKQAGMGVGPALLLSAGALAVGYLSFLIPGLAAGYRGVSELGAVSAFGICVVLFLNLTLLPALLSVMPMRVARATRWTAATRRTWYQSLMRRYALGIVIFAGILGAIAATIAPYAWFDDDPLNLRDANAPSVQTLLELLDDPRVEPYSAVLLAPDLEAAARLAKQFESLPQVEDAVTAEDLIPASQPAKRAVIEKMALVLSPLLTAPQTPPAMSDAARNAAFEELRSLLTRAQGGMAANARNLATVLDRMPRTPDSLIELERALLGRFPPFRERLAALLAPQAVSMDEMPEALRARRLAPDGRALVIIDPRQDLRDPAARQEFVDAVRSVAPAASGPAVRYAAVGETIVGACRQAALTAGILIALLLFLALRRARDAALVLAPPALAAIMTVVTAVLLKMPFNLANIVVLPLILGLGLSFAIQIVMRRRSRDADKLDGGFDGRFMETSTPRAVVFSALTTMGLFGPLALSEHHGTAGLGVLLMLAIGLTMLCTLLVLPALLELASRKDGRKDGRKPAAPSYGP